MPAGQRRQQFDVRGSPELLRTLRLPPIRVITSLAVPGVRSGSPLPHRWYAGSLAARCWCSRYGSPASTSQAGRQPGAHAAHPEREDRPARESGSVDARGHEREDEHRYKCEHQGLHVVPQAAARLVHPAHDAASVGALLVRGRGEGLRPLVRSAGATPPRRVQPPARTGRRLPPISYLMSLGVRGQSDDPDTAGGAVGHRRRWVD